jgi:hypothetical protein
MYSKVLPTFSGQSMPFFVWRTNRTWMKVKYEQVPFEESAFFDSLI